MRIVVSVFKNEFLFSLLFDYCEGNSQKFKELYECIEVLGSEDSLGSRYACDKNAFVRAKMVQ